MSSAKKRKQKQKDMSEFVKVNYKGKNECIGCTYRVKSSKEFQKHLKKHKCDQVKICSKCKIFRTIEDSVYKEHYKDCTGRLEEKEEESSSSEEEVVVEKPKNKKKSDKKMKN